jgi:hypothetical protein
MRIFKQTPASISYHKARLNILKRPTVWAAASGLLLSIFLVGEYLANPQQYTGSNDPDTATSPFNQNPLGNLPTQNRPASSSGLFEMLPDSSTVPTQTSLDTQSPKSDNSSSPLLQKFLLGRSSIAAQKDKPGGLQSPSVLTSSFLQNRRDRSSESGIPSLSSPGSASSEFTGSTLPSLANSRSRRSSLNGSNATNPLQSALDRSSPNGSSPNDRQTPLSPARSLSPSSIDNTSGDSRLSPTATPFRQDSLGRQEQTPLGLPNTQLSPQLSPSPGTTGYTLPPALQNSTPSSISPSSSNGSLQPIPGQISPQTSPALPGQSYGYGQPSSPNGQMAYPSAQPSLVPSSQPMPSPFSVPRAVPGRSIGGGQVNTFSNP